MIIVRSCQILLVTVFVGGCSSDQDDAIQPPLTLNQLRGGIELEQRSSQTVTAQLDSTSRRRDIITEHLRLLVGDTSIPAIACYSSLANTRPLPGLLWMPGSPNIKEDLMYPLDLLPRWAEEGFFVMSIDRPFHGDRPGNREREIRQRGWPPVFGDYVADLTLSLDYLASRSQVDPERLGMVGLSTGGLEALVVGALDPRVKAVVCVSGQLAWPQVFATDAWKHIFAGLSLADSLVAARTPGPQALVCFTEQMPGLGVLDAARVAPLLAPRPLLLLGELQAQRAQQQRAQVQVVLEPAEVLALEPAEVLALELVVVAVVVALLPLAGVLAPQAQAARPLLRVAPRRL